MFGLVGNLVQDLLSPSPRALLKRINRLEDSLRLLPDAELTQQTEVFKQRLAEGERTENLIPEAFAVCREAARRVLGMRPFDVQLLGGISLARGHIAEMKTGEGKTLVATLPAYLWALHGKGVHLVTVNDYLARRDADWMGKVFRFLGLSVGCIQEDMGAFEDDDREARKKAYACDITYGTNSEIVFDFLRDKLVSHASERVHRPTGAFAAIVDELDLLLIDEAQTPLIISGEGREDTALYAQMNRVIRRLDEREDYTVDYKTRSVAFTDEGLLKVENTLGRGNLSDPDNLELFHAAYRSLQAHGYYRRDVHYIVDAGRVFLIDEHTGRVSEDKRFSDGLHQALEAKEGVPIRAEDRTLAKTSYQFYFRSYPHLCGMTGTAWSVRDECLQVYGLKTDRIATYRPMIREDYQRIVFRTTREKLLACADEIEELHQQGRPVLVGSVSVRESERLSKLLKARRIAHKVLNAKHHEREAAIIAQAGRKGAVTISTNMAGRGTDIRLGGDPEGLAHGKDDAEVERIRSRCDAEGDAVRTLGGLAVIGTGEHESERLDQQLRGRAGRQGDPGSSLFLVSLQDPLYEMFGNEQIIPQMQEHFANHPDREPLEDRNVERTLHDLRDKVVQENAGIRKDVLKYDAIVHEQREHIWAWRDAVLDTGDDAASWQETARGHLAELATSLWNDPPEELQASLDAQQREAQSRVEKEDEVRGQGALILDTLVGTRVEVSQTNLDLEGVIRLLQERYSQRLDGLHDGLLAQVERQVLLQAIDEVWTDYLTNLERVEEGIGLRGYGNLDPVVEFRREAGLMARVMMQTLLTHAVRLWLRLDASLFDESRKAKRKTRNPKLKRRRKR